MWGLRTPNSSNSKPTSSAAGAGAGAGAGTVLSGSATSGKHINASSSENDPSSSAAGRRAEEGQEDRDVEGEAALFLDLEADFVLTVPLSGSGEDDYDAPPAGSLGASGERSLPVASRPPVPSRVVGGVTTSHDTREMTHHSSFLRTLNIPIGGGSSGSGGSNGSGNGTGVHLGARPRSGDSTSGIAYQLSRSLRMPRDLEGYEAHLRQMQCEGYLERRSCKHGTVWKRSWFLLKDGALSYFSDEAEAQMHKVRKGASSSAGGESSHHPSSKRRLPLDSVEAVRTEDDEDEYGQNCFRVISSDREDLVLRADTKDDMQEWLFGFHRILASIIARLLERPWGESLAVGAEDSCRLGEVPAAKVLGHGHGRGKRRSSSRLMGEPGTSPGAGMGPSPPTPAAEEGMLDFRRRLKSSPGDPLTPLREVRNEDKSRSPVVSPPMPVPRPQQAEGGGDYDGGEDAHSRAQRILTAEDGNSSLSSSDDEGGGEAEQKRPLEPLEVSAPRYLPPALRRLQQQQQQQQKSTTSHRPSVSSSSDDAMFDFEDGADGGKDVQKQQSPHALYLRPSPEGDVPPLLPWQLEELGVAHWYGRYEGAYHTQLPCKPDFTCNRGVGGELERAGGLWWRSGVSSIMGRRDKQEDRYCVIPQYERLVSGSTNVALQEEKLGFFGVYDGHCGYEAAQFAADRLHLLMAAAAEGGSEGSISQTFLSLDDQFLELCQENEWYSGTTALVALLSGRKLLVANLGDCEAILCRRNEALALSAKHKPDREDETDRILRAGGWVTTERELFLRQLKQMDLSDPLIRSTATSHVKWTTISRLCGELSVSRAIGDTEFKGFKQEDGQGGERKGKEPVDPTLFSWPKGHSGVFYDNLVTAEPELFSVDVTEEDKFLLLACDGLWDVMTHDEAVLHASALFARGFCAQAVSQHLCELALRMGTSDNVTVIAVSLHLAGE
jgi:serine/threonine protein phosphatase PrpC